MYDRFGYPGLFAAYNAGPVRYARHLETGRPLPSETVAYMAAVAGGSRARAALPSAPVTQALFALRAPAGSGAADAPPDTAGPSLFAIVRLPNPR